jgi:hypothetical protein
MQRLLHRDCRLDSDQRRPHSQRPTLGTSFHISVYCIFSLFPTVFLMVHDAEALQGKNMLWYLTIFGAGVAVSRALIPDSHMVFRPQQYLDKVTAALNLHITFDPLLILLYRGLVYASLTGSQVCDHLQYKPAKWRGRAHHPDVYAKFVRLYDYRIMTFLREMASVLLVPPPPYSSSLSLSVLVPLCFSLVALRLRSIRRLSCCCSPCRAAQRRSSASSTTSL